MAKLRTLNDMAKGRGQTLAQMALAWLLNDNRITSTLMGASKVTQIEDAAGAASNTDFSKEELRGIDAGLA